MVLLAMASNAAIQGDAAVLVSTALLAILNFAPTDAIRMSSAQTACAITPPASSGVAKRRRQAARTWRSVVRIKVIGQMIGLVSIVQTGDVLRGAALVMTANAVHLVWGAGDARHDAGGAPAPMDGGVCGALLAAHTALAVAAFLGAASSLGSTRRLRCALLYSAGALGFALAGLPAFLRALLNLLDVAGEPADDVYVPPSEGGPTD